MRNICRDAEKEEEDCRTCAHDCRSDGGDKLAFEMAEAWTAQDAGCKCHTDTWTDVGRSKLETLSRPVVLDLGEGKMYKRLL